ncbi:MAG TPA: helix-turn-helix transcriptional regulator [Gammaproteobacteria bacterium]|jgi:DNA-binding CsgD family transcriptional regulator|nr:helix-turn-helix transcriptional regulator [Gammaproteobacteria bacterium]
MKDLYEQELNYLSIDLLEKLGNHKPVQKQIDLMESILSNVVVIKRLRFTRKLTEREVSCLYWAALGRTSKTTAALLNIQTNTVEQYRKAIKRKLFCKSMAEAVFKGIQFGYVHPLRTKKIKKFSN